MSVQSIQLSEIANVLRAAAKGEIPVYSVGMALEWPGDTESGWVAAFLGEWKISFDCLNGFLSRVHAAELASGAWRDCTKTATADKSNVMQEPLNPFHWLNADQRLALNLLVRTAICNEQRYREEDAEELQHCMVGLSVKGVA